MAGLKTARWCRAAPLRRLPPRAAHNPGVGRLHQGKLARTSHSRTPKLARAPLSHVPRPRGYADQAMLTGTVHGTVEAWWILDLEEKKFWVAVGFSNAQVPLGWQSEWAWWLPLCTSLGGHCPKGMGERAREMD